MLVDCQVREKLKTPVWVWSLTSQSFREAGHITERSRHAHNATIAQNEHEKVRRQTIQDVRDAYLNVISGISRVKALAAAVESNEAAARAARKPDFMREHALL